MRRSELMSREMINDRTSTASIGTVVPSQSDVFDGVQGPTRSVLHEYISEMRMLNKDLTRCQEEIASVRLLAKGTFALPQFEFDHALNWKAHETQGAGDKPEDALKQKLAAPIQKNASERGGMCRSPEEEDAFMMRLQTQFLGFRATLIQSGAEGCAAKIESLCAHIEKIAQRLGPYVELSSSTAERLEVMARELRSYNSEAIIEICRDLQDKDRETEHKDKTGWERFERAVAQPASLDKLLEDLAHLTTDILQSNLSQAAA